MPVRRQLGVVLQNEDQLTLCLVITGGALKATMDEAWEGSPECYWFADDVKQKCQWGCTRLS